MQSACRNSSIREVAMKRFKCFALATLLAASVCLSGCGSHKDDAAAEAPPPAQVDHEQDGSVIRVDRLDQFPVVAAVEHDAAPQLVVTGVVNPDVSRTVPVVTLASGRIVNV